MRNKNSAPTMKDVALEAGVALGTVSKVINGLPVGESYKIRVEKAIKKLDYQVNSYAQGLKASRTYTVALLIPNTINPFFAKLAYQINISLLKENIECCFALRALTMARNRNISLWHSKIRLTELLVLPIIQVLKLVTISLLFP